MRSLIFNGSFFLFSLCSLLLYLLPVLISSLYSALFPISPFPYSLYLLSKPPHPPFPPPPHSVSSSDNSRPSPSPSPLLLLLLTKYPLSQIFLSLSFSLASLASVFLSPLLPLSFFLPLTYQRGQASLFVSR